jgi:hypothetical protein
MDPLLTRRFELISLIHYLFKARKYCATQGSPNQGEVGDFFALVSMKSPNFCQKAKFKSPFQSFQVRIFFTNNHTFSSIFT